MAKVNKTGVGYKGIVTLQLRKGKKKPYKTVVIKNTGTSELFRILCNAVIGNSVNAYMPQFLGVFYYDGSATPPEVPAASVRVHWDDAEVGEESGEYYAKFDFILPGAYVSSSVPTANRLKLYNSPSSDTPLAELDMETPIAMSPDSNLYVTWKMYFSNQAEAESETEA